MEHFDWSWVKEEHMRKIPKSGKIDDKSNNSPWEFRDSISVLFQLEGTSKLSVNKSARDYYLNSKEKIAPTTKQNKKMIRLKYIHVPTRMKNFVPSENEDIDVINLVPGDFFDFLWMGSSLWICCRKSYE